MNQQQKIITMLEMQDRMNKKVHPEWKTQKFEWYRAIWIECGELMDHHGWKWWKKQEPDTAQVQLELVDIWHFGLSIMLQGGLSNVEIAELLSDSYDRSLPQGGVPNFLLAVEAFAGRTIVSEDFVAMKFFDLLRHTGMTIDDLYVQYIGKNTLNFFRQDHGYKDGTYQKVWNDREDNEHLTEILSELSPEHVTEGTVYNALEASYAHRR